MMRALAVFLAFASVFGCGSDSARPQAAQDGSAYAAPDAATSDKDAAAALPDAAEQPLDQASQGWQPDSALPAPVACRDQVLACDGWNDKDVALPLEAIAEHCGLCGTFVVGFVDGCAAEVRFLGLASTNTTTQACVSSAIVGGRWACAPASGWVSLYVSCTLY